MKGRARCAENVATRSAAPALVFLAQGEVRSRHLDLGAAPGAQFAEFFLFLFFFLSSQLVAFGISTDAHFAGHEGFTQPCVIQNKQQHFGNYDTLTLHPSANVKRGDQQDQEDQECQSYGKGGGTE